MPKQYSIALEPPPTIRHALAALDPGLKDVRWVPEEEMVLAVSLLGSTATAAEEEILAAIAEVQVASFFLPVQDVSTFGGDRPNVIWAGVGNGHPHLFAFRKRVQDALLKAGLEPDLRPFQPHIVLGRCKGVSKSVLQPFLRKHAKTEFGLWKVTGFVVLSKDDWPGGGGVPAAEFRGEFPEA